MVTLNLQSFVRGTPDVLDRQTRLPLGYRTIKEREVNSTAIAVARGDTECPARQRDSCGRGCFLRAFLVK
jgi:hypothetical protein